MAPSPLAGWLLAHAVAVNLGIALVMGAWASQAWLGDARTPWSDAARAQGRAWRRLGLVVTALALVGAVGLQAAVMGEVPLLQAGPTAWVLLRDTHIGHVALVGLVAWSAVVAAGWPAAPPGRARLVLLGLGLGLAALAWSRSAVAHAGAQGDFTLGVAIDAAHRLAGCLWVGMVLCATTLRLPAHNAPVAQRLEAVRWVGALSSTATVALVAVLGTGGWKVWRLGTSLTDLVASDHGLVLGSKLGLVALAAGLGGFNRIRVLPGLFDDLRTCGSKAEPGPWRRRLKTVLGFEALVLLLVLVAAAVLARTEPPNP